jgi:hypothetical protein
MGAKYMKLIYRALTIIVFCATALAQGKVALVNDDNHRFSFGTADRMKAADVAFAGTYVNTGTTPLPSGVILKVGLFGGTTAGSLTLQKSLVLNTAGAIPSPGRMSSQSTTLSGIPGGVAAYFKVAIWDNAFATPEAAAAAGSYSGQTAVFTAIPGSSISYPSIVAALGPAQSTWAAGNLVVALPAKTTTTTTLDSSLNPSSYGDSVTFTATVAPTGAGGTVTFKDGATTLGTGTLSGGTASLFTSSLSAGSHSLTAEYAGDSSYSGSTSTALNQTVNKATPSVSTWPSASAISEGQSLADVTLSGGVTSPTGGTFAFDSTATKPPAGTASHAMTYTPADPANYTTVAGSVSVTVNPATVTRTAAASGNWSDPNSWSPTGLPATGDDVIIPAGFNVAVDANTVAIGDLTLQGTLAFTGSSTLKVSGNVALASTATLTPGTGTVELVGSTSQTLTATEPAALTFYKLTVNGGSADNTVTALSKLKVTRKLTVTKGKLVSASDYLDILIEADGTLELTSDITVAGNLEVQAGGTLTTATHKITFDGATVQNLTLAELVQFDDLTVTAGTTLVETDPGNNVLVNGTVLNQGVIRKSQTLDAGEYYYFGLAGNYAAADMEIRVTDRTGSDPLTAIQVDRIDANHPHPPGSNTTGVYWTITPTGADFTADLALPHAGLTSPRVSRYTGSGWVFGRTSFTPDTVTLEGVTAFSDWAVYNVGTPVANPATYSRGRGMSLKISIADLGSDPDGNPLSVVSAGPSVEGATIAWNETYLFYRLAADQGDSFPYTVSNGAESASNTLTVTVPPAAGGLAQEVSVGVGAVTVKFYGIPGLTYDVQRATTLSPANWTTLTASALTLGADGSFSYTDNSPPPGNAYYRSVRH